MTGVFRRLLVQTPRRKTNKLISDSGDAGTTTTITYTISFHWLVVAFLSKTKHLGFFNAFFVPNQSIWEFMFFTEQERTQVHESSD